MGRTSGTWYNGREASPVSDVPPDKGKPTVRWGRKATGLRESSPLSQMAGLPKEGMLASLFRTGSPAVLRRFPL